MEPIQECRTRRVAENLNFLWSAEESRGRMEVYHLFPTEVGNSLREGHDHALQVGFALFDKACRDFHPHQCWSYTVSEDNSSPVQQRV